MSEPLVIDDVEHRLEGARIHLRLAQERATVTLDALGDAVVDAALARVREALAGGASLAEAGPSLQICVLP